MGMPPLRSRRFPLDAGMRPVSNVCSESRALSRTTRLTLSREIADSPNVGPPRPRQGSPGRGQGLIDVLMESRGIMFEVLFTAIAVLGAAPELNDQTFERWRDHVRPRAEE